MKGYILYCFIASAFDKVDVDSIYDNVIAKSLKKHSITPLRVDRVEHNDDIDDKIYELMTKADLCVADLTYARPSVYYEAGYISGIGKPVIYTCRADHFISKDNDLFGNFRVHFDLQMKNIIQWSVPDIKFYEKFDNRLLKVIKPILDKKKLLAKNNIEEKEFSKLSQISKQNLIIENVNMILKKLKYCIPNKQPDFLHPHKSVFGYKNNKVIFAFSEPTVTKKMINDLRIYISFERLEILHENTEEIHIIYFVLRTIPTNRVTEAYPRFSNTEQKTFKAELNIRDKNVDLYIHIVDNIKSISDFKSKSDYQFERYIKCA